MKTQRYSFTYTTSGKDVNGRPIKETCTYSQDLLAKSQEAAEKKLRSTYFKSVIVTIKSVRVTDY